MHRKRAAARLVNNLGSALNTAGLPPLPSRIFAALLGDPDGRMTSAELSTALGASPAGISGAVRYLEHIGLLRREREPGRRHHVYVVEEDAWATVMLRHEETYAPIVAALEQALADLPDDDPARPRVDNSREFLDWIGLEMDGIAERWQVHRARQVKRPPVRDQS